MAQEIRDLSQNNGPLTVTSPKDLARDLIQPSFKGKETSSGKVCSKVQMDAPLTPPGILIKFRLRSSEP